MREKGMSFPDKTGTVISRPETRHGKAEEFINCYSLLLLPRLLPVLPDLLRQDSHLSTPGSEQRLTGQIT
jgi:hypothetical protein